MPLLGAAHRVLGPAVFTRSLPVASHCVRASSPPPCSSCCCSPTSPTTRRSVAAGGFPDAADQAAVEGRLAPGEIEAVVDGTRIELGGQ